MSRAGTLPRDFQASGCFEGSGRAGEAFGASGAGYFSRMTLIQKGGPL